MPSYKQEGKALQGLFASLNLTRISYISQEENRFYKPPEFIDQSKIKISTSLNIPINSNFGLNQATCNDNYIKGRLLKEIIQLYRIYGSSVVLIQLEVCWQAYIYAVSDFYKRIKIRQAFIAGLEASYIISPQITGIIQQNSKTRISILDDGIIALTPKLYIPSNYFELTMYYVTRVLTFIEKMTQLKESDQTFIEVFTKFKGEIFDNKNCIWTEFSVLNLQNRRIVEVLEIKDDQGIQIQDIIYPGPSTIPPPKQFPLEVSYSTNDKEPDGSQSKFVLTSPPMHVPCIIDYINLEQRQISQFYFKANPISYGGLKFDFNYTLQALLENQTEIGIAHLASLLIQS